MTSTKRSVKAWVCLRHKFREFRARLRRGYVIPETAEEMAMHDLVIRGATAVDRHDPIRADLAA